MEIRVLEYFLAVAREQNITAAAEALHISQPALSRQLKNLEEELGKQLLIRGVKGSRKVLLTEEGMILRKRAEEILSLVQKTEKEITLSDEAIAGNVFIGAGETEAVRLFAKTAMRLRQKYPDIRYNISSGNAEHVLEYLDKGLIDFGLLFVEVDPQKYEWMPVPARDIWGVLMRGEGAEAEIAAVGIDEPVKAQGIPEPFVHQQGGIVDQVVGGDNIQFRFSLLKPAIQLGIFSPLL